MVEGSRYKKCLDGPKCILCLGIKGGNRTSEIGYRFLIDWLLALG